MSSKASSIADAVVEHLKASSFSVVMRVSNPEKPQLKVEGDGVHCQVIPVAGGGREKAGRRAVRRSYGVNVYVSAQLNSQLSRDAMLGLVDEVLDALDFLPMADAQWLQTEERSLFDRDALESADRFASLHRLLYAEEYIVA